MTHDTKHTRMVSMVKKRNGHATLDKMTAGGRISKHLRTALSCWDDGEEEEDGDTCDNETLVLYGSVEAVHGSCHALVSAASSLFQGNLVVNLPVRRRQALAHGDILLISPDMQSATKRLDGIDAQSKFFDGVLHPFLFWRYLGGR